MNHDERVREILGALMHAIAVASMIIGHTTPIKLPQDITTDNMPAMRDGFARCLLLLEEEPLASIIPEESARLLQQGLGQLLLADEQAQFLGFMLSRGEASKVPEWKFLAVMDLVATVTTLLYLAEESLNG